VHLASSLIATGCASLAEDGRGVYALRWHWEDGTRAIAIYPLDFIARLVALVPRPRTHLLTCHGVLAPAAK
jgi:Putative transposase